MNEGLCAGLERACEDGQLNSAQFPGQGILQGKNSRRKKVFRGTCINTGDFQSTRELTGILQGMRGCGVLTGECHFFYASECLGNRPAEIQAVLENVTKGRRVRPKTLGPLVLP